LAQTCLEQGDERAAKRLRTFARRKGVSLQTSGTHHSLPLDGGSRLPLVDEEPWPSVPIILNSESEGVIKGFLSDVQNAQKLLEGGVLTRFGLMLSGPPGTGKTLLAGHIAAQLRRPFYVARLDSLISSRLGETAKNIRQIFDFAPARGGVLLLDELDAIAKMRDDRHELGELKRVVNTVIQGLDSLDDQAIVIAATNHAQLLDTAIWRRFPYRCEMRLPAAETRIALWLHFLYGSKPEMRRKASVLSRLSEEFSGADIENVALAARRISLISGGEVSDAKIVLALAKSPSPGALFPEPGGFKRGEKGSLVRQLAEMGVAKVGIEEILHMTHSAVYRCLKGGNDE
jgi:ATPase family protein associated with various cellular activities (AAA)